MPTALPSLPRREFLKTTGAATALLTAPNLLLAQKTDPKLPIVGAGAHRYECLHDWGGLPTGHHYGNASHGTAIDADGLIYISHYGAPGSMFVFDADGKLVRSQGKEFMEKGTGVGHGIDIRREGKTEFLYLSHSHPAFGFAKTTLTGEIVWRRNRADIAKDSGLYDRPNAPFRATNISFLPDGGYLLGDGYGSGYLHRYNREDKYVGSFGGTGTDAGKFKTPHGQWLDQRDGTPKTVVCDRANKRLQWFTPEGRHLKTLDGFLFPADIDIQGEVMLVPDLHCRVTLLDGGNNVLAHLGEDVAWRDKVLAKGSNMRGKRAEWLPGKFIHPHDACFDRAGNIFVAEWVVTGRVTKLRKLA